MLALSIRSGLVRADCITRRATMRHYVNRDLHWEGDRLYASKRLSGFSITRDERYPSMWRVRSPDGTLSDILNPTRAKDAAHAFLNRQETGVGRPHAA